MIARAFFLVAMAAACASTNGCSKGDAPFKPTFGLLAGAGGFEPGSFGARAHAGLLTCASAAGAPIVMETATPGDEDRALMKLATENPDEVIAAGGEFAEPLKFVAKNYEGTHFGLIDGIVDRPNVTSVTFKDEDGSFLAGALAALVTKTKHVAFLGGADIPRLYAARAGFAAGIREIDPSVQVTTAFAGSFVDKAAGSVSAGKLYASGADIVYVVAGAAGIGALEAARNAKNGYAIGADSNQDALVPGKILTSVLRRYDNAANRLCQEIAGQKGASATESLGLAEDGVGLTRFAYSRAVVGAANIARIGRVRDAIVAGSIVPPSTLEAAAAFRPVAVR